VNLPRIRNYLESVSEHALFKLFLVFEKPWWKEPTDFAALRAKIVKKFPATGTRARVGWRALTDEPLRQIYHYTVPKRGNGGVLGVVMASYSDEHYSDFWRPLAKKSAQGGKHSRPYCNMKRLTPIERLDLDISGAPEGLVMKALAQLRNVHGLKAIPKPLVAYAKDWNDSHTHCGWHTWNPGVRSYHVLQALRNPMNGLYLCGEAYSTEQGWIEGALKSAELVLLSMGVDPPSWLAHHSKRSLANYCLA